LQQEVEALLARAAQADAAEANEPRPICRRRSRGAAAPGRHPCAKQRLEARQRAADANVADAPTTTINRRRVATDRPQRGRGAGRAFGEPHPKAQDNFTDPDSRIMKTSAGFEQCYNGQTAVDAHAQIIVARN